MADAYFMALVNKLDFKILVLINKTLFICVLNRSILIVQLPICVKLFTSLHHARATWNCSHRNLLHMYLQILLNT